jgi:hypothetical protein
VEIADALAQAKAGTVHYKAGGARATGEPPRWPSILRDQVRGA